MKILCVLLVPAFLAVVIQGEIKIFPEGASKIHDLTLGQTSPVILSCMVIDLSVEEAQLKWYDNNNKQITATEGSTFIQFEEESLELLIISPTDDDTGIYTCRGIINNEEQEASKELKLYRGIKVLSSKKQFVVNGTDDKVWCRTAASDIKPKFSWYKVAANEDWIRIRSDDKYEVHSPKNAGEEPAYLLIRNVSLDDEDTYNCNIDIRILGKSHAHFIEVVVTVPPTFTGELDIKPKMPKEGDRLEVKCKADGKPPPLYNFRRYSDATRKDGVDVLTNSTEGVFMIEKVTRNDEGFYECEAFNQGGSENVSDSIDVTGLAPVIEKAENITQEEESSVRLACIATGDPAPSLNWTLHDDPQHVFGDDPSQKIYVEEESLQEQGMDPLTRVYRRTLYLVIPSLLPRHAGFYVCQASNLVDTVDHTVFIDVTYKPIFADMVDSHFYGWIGSKTSLTCAANGNPEPEITWYKDDVELKSDDTYDITEDETDSSTKTVSYLKPKVDEINQAAVFGKYKCEARNLYGKNEVELDFKLALVPEEAEVDVLYTYPTAFTLQLTRPVKEGGQSVTKFIITYDTSADGLDAHTMEVALSSGELTSEAELTGLIPNTKYNITVIAVNSVGQGHMANTTATTADFSKPEKVNIVSNREGTEETSYTLKWTVPMTGGARIKKYIVEYAVAQGVNKTSEPWEASKVSSDSVTVNVDDESTTEVKINRLLKDTYYQVKIKAINRIGSSEVSTFIFKTSLRDTPGGAGGPQMGAAALVLVTMATAYLHPLF